MSLTAHVPTTGLAAHDPTTNLTAHDPTTSLTTHDPTMSLTAHVPLLPQVEVAALAEVACRKEEQNKEVLMDKGYGLGLLTLLEQGWSTAHKCVAEHGEDIAQLDVKPWCLEPECWLSLPQFV